MHGMHEDMNGSAVALGLLLAASKADLPVNLDVWLAIGPEPYQPKAYKQNDVVTALTVPPSKSSIPMPRAAWCWPIRSPWPRAQNPTS